MNGKEEMTEAFAAPKKPRQFAVQSHVAVAVRPAPLGRLPTPPLQKEDG